MAQRELDALEEGVTVGWEGTEEWKTGHYWLLVTQIFLLVLNYMVDILGRKREEGGGPGDQGEPQPGEEPGAERRGRGNTGTSPDPSTGLARTLTSNVPGRRFCCSLVLYC